MPEIPEEKDSNQSIPEDIRKLAHREASEPIFKLPGSADRDAKEYQKAMQESGPYLTLGIQLALFIVVCVGAGYWIDSKYGTSPTWTAILAITGCVLGMSYFLITVIRLSKKEETKRRQN